MTDYLAYAYAAAVTAGGVVGYIKKGSMMSGIMVSLHKYLLAEDRNTPKDKCSIRSRNHALFWGITVPLFANFLLQGLVFGGLIGLGAYQTSQNPSNFHFLLGVATVLAGIMGKRWISGGVFMPAGLVAAMSLMMVTRYALRWVEISNNSAPDSGAKAGHSS